MTLILLLVAGCLALGAAQETIPSKPSTIREILYSNPQPLRLNCYISTELGKNVKYEWRKDGEALPSGKGEIDSRDGSLRFTATDLTSEGSYECLAKSDLGVASSGLIKVKRSYINMPQKVATQTHSPVRGEPFELMCPQVDAYPKAKIAWLRQEKPFGDSPKKHYSTVRTTIGPNGYLYFANVTDEDAGKDFKYICATVHPAAKETVVLAEHVIEGLKDAKPVHNKAVPQYLSTDVVAKEGESIFLYCVYGGALAPPDYFFEGKNVNGDEDPEKQRVTRHNRSKGRRLIIKDVRLSDQGTYSCKISEADGTVTEKSMKLAVVSAPAFFKKAETKTVAKQNSDVTIPCQVTGVPAPQIIWTYNGKPLGAGGKISYSPKKSGAVESNDLKIKRVEKPDDGYYGCKAVNEHGEIYTETLLSVA